MLFRVLLIVAAIGLVYWYWLRGMPPAQRRVALRNTALVLVGGALVLMAVTGRAHWLFGLLGGLLPFLRSLGLRLLQMKLIQWLGSQTLSRQASAAASPGRRSEVATETVRMFLDHDSGELSGEVLVGPHAGRQLGELSFEQLLALYRDCRAGDPQGAELLASYLERTHAAAWEAAHDSAAGAGREGVAASGNMSDAEARQVLGVSADATPDEIRDAHRRLMQRLHPDRGGSSFLAAQINRAKDVLLGN